MIEVEQIEINSELRDLIPPLSDDEFRQLEKNIIEDGVRDPLTVAIYPDEDGQECRYLCDGHNRYSIANKHGLKFNVVQREFSGLDEAKVWIIDNQRGRRNLSDFVRFELEQVRAELLRKKGEERMSKMGAVGRKAQIRGLSIIDKPLEAPHNTRKEVAASLGWSTGKVAMADVVNKKADEETKDRLRKNEISINQAYQEVKRVHVSNNSGENEWYTPLEYVESARKVLGSIDLDPASSEVANEKLKAEKIYTIDDDGLKKDWRGNVWLNPPYAQPIINEFCQKMVDEYSVGNVEGIVLVNNATETKWFQLLADAATAICFPKGRIRYWYPGRPSNGPLQGQAFLYFGLNTKDFESEFDQYGFVVF